MRWPIDSRHLNTAASRSSLFLQNLKNTTHFLCQAALEPRLHARSDVVGRRPLDQHPVQYSECVLTNCSWPRTQSSSSWSKEQYIEIQTNTEVYCTLHWADYSLYLSAACYYDDVSFILLGDSDRSLCSQNLLYLNERCLKITEKVSFNIASYNYI